MGFEQGPAPIKLYFQDLLEQALGSLQVKTGETTEQYLVDLLTGYATPQRTQDLSTPFVEQLVKALATSGTERSIRMRCLGDDALFVSGFLADSCAKRGVSTTYVITIGARAYREAGSSQVLNELALRFESFSKVLDEVRELTAFCTDGSIIAMYEKWADTHSPQLFHRLVRRGVLPTVSSKTPH
jgi:hypothetical protein